MIPGCEVAPLGIVAQTPIDEGGEPQRKLRLTHDQSFSPKGSSSRSAQRQGQRNDMDPGEIREGVQQVSVPHLVPEEDQDGRTHLHDKKRLQIRIQTDPPAGTHGSEGVHVR